ncbi:MAG: DUF3426 domain-containing protein, partial [Pseudomonadota bacterium]
MPEAMAQPSDAAAEKPPDPLPAAAVAEPSPGLAEGAEAPVDTDLLAAQIRESEALHRARLADVRASAYARSSDQEERRPLDGPKSGGSAPLILGWVLLLAVIGAVVAGGWYYRQDVVAAIPEVSRFYAWLGIEVTPARADGLTVTNLVVREESEDGDPTLVLSGTLSNTSTSTRPVPTMNATVLDQAGNQILQ